MDLELTAFRRTAIESLLRMRDPDTGVWTGELSSSALSTSLTLVALLKEHSCHDQVEAALAWLLAHQNEDGGWGDTPVSQSNLSTTILVRSALRALARHRQSELPSSALRATDRWLTQQMGGISFTSIVRALREIYQEDRTFAIPILTFVAICEEDEQLWKEIPSLPFLFALLPQSLYRFFRLEVVSYALPALIAIGMCGNRCRARRWKALSSSALFAKPLLAKLEKLQPEHGGFLDATPLTAFVAIALEKMGYGTHLVARRAKAFLKASLRVDGSCAIDSNLRIWVTNLATRALLSCRDEQAFPLAERDRIARWLLSKQFQKRHPYTGAKPGGWAWTDCAGGVPDADDTCGALIALYYLKQQGVTIPVEEAVRAGLAWLMSVQNSDGGIPTFCKGWGRLPFDRSCPDISAHALVAFLYWQELEAGAEETIERLLSYLAQTQGEDGSWIPLWFGNEASARKQNPIIGTARVLDALLQLLKAGHPSSPVIERMISRSIAFLLREQRPEGSWGAGTHGSHEETGLAVIALKKSTLPAAREAVVRGRRWLVEQGENVVSAPIGLYFSLLWYHEKMYPWVWTLEALSENDCDA
jgi:squalene-hopene/tetraprenyl-beta-curcumene cyclase